MSSVALGGQQNLQGLEFNMPLPTYPHTTRAGHTDLGLSAHLGPVFLWRPESFTVQFWGQIIFGGGGVPLGQERV